MTLYYLPLINTTFGTTEDNLLPHVSPLRQEKISKLHSAEDQRLSLYAALTARYGLSLATGIPADQLTFCVEKNRKPQLLDHPGVDFSFSHTKGFVLCGVSMDGPIGVDVERIRKAPLNVMRRAFSPEEIQYVSTASFEMNGEHALIDPALDPQADARFFEIWTKKEAITKCHGTGLATELSRINTLDDSLAADFYCSRQNDYICSAYCSSKDLMTQVLLTEELLQDHFLHFSASCL